MVRLGVIAVLFLGAGVVGTILLKPARPWGREVRHTDPADLVEQMRRQMMEEFRVDAEPRRTGEKKPPNPQKATPESVGADKTLAWLKTLNAKRFRWLSMDQALTLRELDLSKLSLDPEDLKHLAGFPALARINLRGSTITDDGLAVLATLQDLQSLELQGANISDKGVAHLAKLGALAELGLNNTSITDAGLAHLKNNTVLESIQLNGTKITDVGLDHLKGLPITSIAIGATAVTDAGMETLRNFKLSELSIYRNQQITDAGMRHLSEQTTLETLMMRGVKVSGNGLAYLKNLKNLKELNASLSMDDASMPQLKNFTGLKRLHLYSNPGITDAGIAHIRDLKQIEALSLQFTKITDAALEMIAQLPNVRVLDVRGTQVTPGGAQKFRAARPDVKLWH